MARLAADNFVLAHVGSKPAHPLCDLERKCPRAPPHPAAHPDYGRPVLGVHPWRTGYISAALLHCGHVTRAKDSFLSDSMRSFSASSSKTHPHLKQVPR